MLRERILSPSMAGSAALHLAVALALLISWPWAKTIRIGSVVPVNIVANGPQAVRAGKRLIQEVAGQDITPALRDHTARHIADIRASEEGRAGLHAFLNKTVPAWQQG